ncbi:MAG: hypothetical protein JNK72_24770 [Myxococcales bacterium]|nr:hypothetical protein [Myxococcales bacterium]
MSEIRRRLPRNNVQNYSSTDPAIIGELCADPYIAPASTTAATSRVNVLSAVAGKLNLHLILKGENGLGNAGGYCEIIIEGATPADIPTAVAATQLLANQTDGTNANPQAGSVRGDHRLTELLATTAKGYRAILVAAEADATGVRIGQVSQSFALLAGSYKVTVLYGQKIIAATVVVP